MSPVLALNSSRPRAGRRFDRWSRAPLSGLATHFAFVILANPGGWACRSRYPHSTMASPHTPVQIRLTCRWRFQGFSRRYQRMNSGERLCAIEPGDSCDTVLYLRYGFSEIALPNTVPCPSPRGQPENFPSQQELPFSCSRSGART
jgi:hypothetical protein